MCGIAGFVETGSPLPALDRLQRMLARLAHRGPDATGWDTWPDPPVAFGQTRLAIVDLSPAGRQPMWNEDRTLMLVCNGEIYNHRQLRQLLRRPHRFCSQCDVEVLLHLYEDWGSEFLPQVNGMFALALWDGTRRQLLLARDRFGVKPLYYAQHGGRFLFASEIKALLAAGMPVEPDPLALAEHFTWQWTTGERTWFRGIRLLEPGHWLTVSAAGEIHGPYPYYTLGYDAPEARSLEAWRQDLLDVFSAAVRRQLMSDVPLGSYLSGGMDTGSIAAVAARHLPGLHTFTCGFEPRDRVPGDVGCDEREASWELARLLGTQHHEFLLRPSDMPACLDRLIWHLEYPVAGISYQVYSLAREVRRYVTVVLGGTGGDELFAGYPWRYAPILDTPDGAFADRYYDQWLRFLTDEEKGQLFLPEWARQFREYSTRARFRELVASSAGQPPLHRALTLDMQTFLQGLLLVEDKLSMAHGLESRVPFLDNELFELLRRMPADLKMRGHTGKWILKEAMRELLPPQTLQRPKQGFTPPEQTWFRGPNRAFVYQLLMSPDSRLRCYVRPEAVESIWDEFIGHRRNHRQLIWSLLLLERWHRVFVDGHIPVRHVPGASAVAA